MKYRNNKYVLPIIAFLIPIVLIIIYTIVMQMKYNGNFFFNGENYLMADGSSQYSSLYSYLRDVLHGGGSLFYSFTKGLGGNMMSTVGYYLASPLNIIFIFASKTNISLFIFILLLIKLGLCGLFMYIFLSHKFNIKSYSLLIFSSMYALMGYNISYYFNNMWLDVVYLLPLVLLGLDKILKKESPILYCITLAIAIFSNFYIAYMMAIFICIYFVYEVVRIYNLKKDFKVIKTITIRFILFSLLAGGLASILLIPAVLNLSQIMRFPIDKNLLNVSFNEYKELAFSKVISKLYLGSHIPDTVLSRQNPNLYSGILTFVLTVFYFFNKKIKFKEKVLTFIILSFFFISFLNPYLNLLWHGMSFPNGYVYRFSFVFTFFLILISCKSFINLEIKIVPTILIVLIGWLISSTLIDKKLLYLSNKNIIINCVFILIYLVTLILIKKAKKEKLFKSMLLLFVLVELYINLSLTMITNVDFRARKMHTDFYNDTCKIVSNLEDNFYRIDGDYLFSYLDEMICDTKGLTTSLTTNNGDLYRWLYLYGYPLNFTTVLPTPNNAPVMETLFGIKYFYSKDLNNDFYKKVNNFNVKRYNHVADEYYNSNINLYSNTLALSLGYLIDNDYDKIYTKYDKSNPFEYQNAFVSSLIGRNIKIYESLEKKKEKEYGSFKFTIKDNPKHIYLGFRYKIPINIEYFAELSVNGTSVASLSSENSGIVRLDNNYGNGEIEVTLRYNNNVKEDNDLIENSLVMYTFNEDNFYEAIDQLNDNQMKVQKIKGNYVKGTIKTDQESTLFTSIPYEKGWIVYVDGKRQDILKINDEWVGVKLNKGTHTIEFKFIPTGFLLGCFITIISSSILIILIKKNRYNKAIEKGE